MRLLKSAVALVLFASILTGCRPKNEGRSDEETRRLIRYDRLIQKANENVENLRK